MRGKKVSFRRFSQFKLTDFILSCLIFRVDGIQNEFLCGRMPGLDGLVVSNGNLNIDSRFHGDGTGDLADSITGGVQVNDTLVDTHLELVPSLGTFSARGLTGGDSEQINDTLVDTHLELVPSLGPFSARGLTGGDSE